jgi:hypothetical protein
MTLFPPLVITWSSYDVPASLVIAFVLFVIGAAMIALAIRMTRDFSLPKMGKGLGAVVIVVWAFSILAFLRIVSELAKTQPAAASLGSIFPITITSAFCTAGYVSYVCRKDGVKSALGNGFLAFIAGPMAFEFPFVVIVAPRAEGLSVFPLAEVVFFASLVSIIFTTLSLLLLSRRVSITRSSMYLYGSMILVFGLWAADGFSYPAEPLAFTLNAISKILGFASIGALFKSGERRVASWKTNHIFETSEPNSSSRKHAEKQS